MKLLSDLVEMVEASGEEHLRKQLLSPLSADGKFSFNAESDGGVSW